MTLVVKMFRWTTMSLTWSPSFLDQLKLNMNLLGFAHLSNATKIPFMSKVPLIGTKHTHTINPLHCAGCVRD